MKINQVLFCTILIAFICCNGRPKKHQNSTVNINKSEGKSKIRIKGPFLYIDSFKLPILVEYDKFKIDTLPITQQNAEIEDLIFNFTNSIDQKGFSIKYTKYSQKYRKITPSEFLNKSDFLSLHLDPSYKRVLEKSFLLNGTYKYLFTFFGDENYWSQFSYFSGRHYFELVYRSPIQDSVNTNKIMEHVFDTDFKKH